MSPNKFRLKRQKSTPKRQKSPRTPKQRAFQSLTTPASVASSGSSPQFPWQSQEVHDGVTWDYRSPMQQKLRSAKKHGKAGVTELLKCINHEAEKRQKTSLLDTWISAGQTIISPIQCYSRKSSESHRRRLQKTGHPRHLAKELQELSEAVNKNDNDKEHEETRILSASCIETNGNSRSDKSKKLCATNLLDNSESEEVWGIDNESFLIQATQAIEQAEDEYVNKQLSYITSVQISNANKKCAAFMENYKSVRENKTLKNLQIAESSDINNKMDVVCHVDVAENFWESDSSFDEILGSLPYDELAEETSFKEKPINNTTKNSCLVKYSASASSWNSPKSVAKNTSESKLKRCQQDKIIHEKRNKTDNNRCLIISDKKSSLFSAVSTMNLHADTIEWDSDEFDAVMMQTEILTALEQAECKALGNKKCTPEEIARKKAEALQRRKRNYLNKNTMPYSVKQNTVWKDRLRSKLTDISKHQK